MYETKILLENSRQDGTGPREAQPHEYYLETSPKRTKKSRPKAGAIQIPILAPARDRFVGANGEFALTTSMTIVVSRM